jgi:hypothetical protein
MQCISALSGTPPSFTTQPEALPAPAKITARAEHAAELLPNNGINIRLKYFD